MTTSPFDWTFSCIIFPRNPSKLGQSMNKMICPLHREEIVLKLSTLAAGTPSFLSDLNSYHYAPHFPYSSHTGFLAFPQIHQVGICLRAFTHVDPSADITLPPDSCMTPFLTCLPLTHIYGVHDLSGYMLRLSLTTLFKTATLQPFPNPQ